MIPNENDQILGSIRQLTESEMAMDRVLRLGTALAENASLKAENTRLKEIIEDALLLIDSGDGYEIYRKKNDLPFLKDELYSNYLGRLRNHWSNRAAEAVKGDKL